jgi:hypothetical protein
LFYKNQFSQQLLDPIQSPENESNSIGQQLVAELKQTSYYDISHRWDFTH